MKISFFAVLSLLIVAVFLVACSPKLTEEGAFADLESSDEEIDVTSEEDSALTGHAYQAIPARTPPIGKIQTPYARSECFSCTEGKLLVGTMNNIGEFSSPAAIFFGQPGSSSSPIVLAAGGSGANGGAVVGDAVRASFVHPNADGSFATQKLSAAIDVIVKSIFAGIVDNTDLRIRLLQNGNDVNIARFVSTGDGGLILGTGVTDTLDDELLLLRTATGTRTHIRLFNAATAVSAASRLAFTGIGTDSVVHDAVELKGGKSQSWTESASTQDGELVISTLVDGTLREQAIFDEPSNAETALLLRRNVGGEISVVRVTMGAPDSGGYGFKVLRVPND